MIKLQETRQIFMTFKSNLRISALLITGLFLLSNCAQLPKTSGTSNPAPAFSSTQASKPSPLVFAYEFPKLSLEEQRKKLASLNQVSALDAKTKLELAIAYSLPTSRVRDYAKAQPLLEELLADKTLDAETRALASVIQEYLNEANKSNLKAREEQKRADSTQQKLDELQKKLDDLKNIEKTMVDRDQGVRK
ncbi:MAG: hypothetical protein U1E13_00975 [Methylophilaceae bacterium]|nr:hypothetical protein [Methylophilaceae bacterium]